MYKVFYLLLFVLCTASACNNEDSSPRQTPCSVNNPARDLPWLKEKVGALRAQDSSYEYIQQATYRGQTVFVFENCCPHCNTIVPVYNCRGELICTLYSKECPDFADEVKDRTTIATAKKTLCNL
jgi:hypothetical protein